MLRRGLAFFCFLLLQQQIISAKVVHRLKRDGPSIGCCAPSATIYLTGNDDSDQAIWYYDVESGQVAYFVAPDYLYVMKGNEGYRVNVTAKCTLDFEVHENLGLRSEYCLTDEYESRGLHERELPNGEIREFLIFALVDDDVTYEKYYNPSDKTCVAAGMRLQENSGDFTRYFTKKVVYGRPSKDVFERLPAC